STVRLKRRWFFLWLPERVLRAGRRPFSRRPVPPPIAGAGKRPDGAEKSRHQRVRLRSITLRQARLVCQGCDAQTLAIPRVYPYLQHEAARSLRSALNIMYSRSVAVLLAFVFLAAAGLPAQSRNFPVSDL